MSSSRKYLYPDIADILERKAAARRENSRRPYSEKLDLVEELRDRLAPLARARKARRYSNVVKQS
jgi:fibrillarin-like rRNA methylase